MLEIKLAIYKINNSKKEKITENTQLFLGIKIAFIIVIMLIKNQKITI